MKDYKDKHYKLWVFTDDQKVTQADFDQFKYDHLKHMSQFGGNYKEEAEKWFVELKDLFDRINGWIN